MKLNLWTKGVTSSQYYQNIPKNVAISLVMRNSKEALIDVKARRVLKVQVGTCWASVNFTLGLNMTYRVEWDKVA